MRERLLFLFMRGCMFENMLPPSENGLINQINVANKH